MKSPARFAGLFLWDKPMKRELHVKKDVYVLASVGKL
jgi:hypothetical protein